MTSRAPLPRRTYPCGECPIRVDTADNPASQFPARRWAELASTVRDGDGPEPALGTGMFGCHKGPPGGGDDVACAGWLARFGRDHMSVRVAVVTGRLPFEALEPGPGWPELHATWQDVVDNHTATDDHDSRACGL